MLRQSIYHRFQIPVHHSTGSPWYQHQANPQLSDPSGGNREDWTWKIITVNNNLFVFTGISRWAKMNAPRFCLSFYSLRSTWRKYSNSSMSHVGSSLLKVKHVKNENQMFCWTKHLTRKKIKFAVMFVFLIMALNCFNYINHTLTTVAVTLLW